MYRALLAFLLLQPSAPALACQCVPRSDTEQLLRSEVAFRGTVLDNGTTMGEIVSYQFLVTEVRKGYATLPGTKVVVTTPKFLCGAKFESGDDAVIFGSHWKDGSIRISLCGVRHRSSP